MGHPQGTRGHSHMFGDRVQGMGVLVWDRALVMSALWLCGVRS